MKDRRMKRLNRRGDIRNQSQDRTHEPNLTTTISITRPFYRHVRDLDIETQRVIANMTVWDMNAVSRWVQAQEGALPKPPYTADQKILIEGLQRVKNLLAHVELLLVSHQKRSGRKN